MERFGAKIREPTGGEMSTSSSSTGAETFGASVFVTRKGGTIVTCASTSGYMHEYDNRYLWMNLEAGSSPATSPTTPGVVGGQPPSSPGRSTRPRRSPHSLDGSARPRWRSTNQHQVLAESAWHRGGPRCPRRGDARHHIDARSTASCGV